MTTNPPTLEPEAASPATDKERLAALWQEYTARVPNDAAAFDEIYKARVAQGIAWHCCKSPDIDKDTGERLLRCKNCKEGSSITAGTFFDHVKRPHAVLGAIFIKEHGVRLRSQDLHKLSGVAYATAWHISQKLSTVINSQMGEEAIAVLSSRFTETFCRRSRETPARQHPSAEQEQIEKDSHESMGTAQSPHCSAVPASGLSAFTGGQDSFGYGRGEHQPATSVSTETEVTETAAVCGFSDVQRQVYELLSAKPAHFDSLCERSGISDSHMNSTLTLLELTDLVVRAPGNNYSRKVSTDRYARCSGDAPPERIGKTIDAFVDFVKSTFKGISRKYLQNYLATYWCLVDRVRWPRNSLLKECLRFGSISYNDILSYVSPLSVKVRTGFNGE